MTEVEWLACQEPQRMLEWAANRERYQSVTRKSGPHGMWPPMSDRKLRLWACASMRLVQDRLADPRLEELVGVAERFADGLASSKDRGLAFNKTDVIEGPTLGYCLQGCLRSDAAAGAVEVARYIYEDVWSRLAALLREVVGSPFRPAAFDPAWRTADVLALATAAYLERPGQRCEACNGRGGFDWYPEDGPSNSRLEGPIWTQCPDCPGSGRIEDGRLDPVRLAILADALEEAGCEGSRCPTCKGSGLYGQEHPWGDTRATEWLACHDCEGTGSWPHPLLAHLRGPGPHVRGCWVVDCVLGRS